ncbi:RHS repeat-associated core domain-containing protein [Vibrio parahaemolyticus]|uniref:RHS repeat-associated core domain-containing protein n=1 Tax=Vibrio parahaemolyticus TaxID=670 RepID=UPI00235EE0F3|nr:RHS repeat-associated core domain-containing protein [Vibrio parahaemolyticus]
MVRKHRKEKRSINKIKNESTCWEEIRPEKNKVGQPLPATNINIEVDAMAAKGLSRRQVLQGMTSAAVFYAGSGSLSFAFTIDEQGKVVVLDKNPLGFTGQYQDLKTGLYPLGNGYRSYSPSLKRFLQYDREQSPFADGGINGYCYGMNNPTLYYDPNGRFVITISLLISAAIAVAKAVIKLAVVIAVTEAVRLTTIKIAKAFGADERTAELIGHSLGLAVSFVFGFSAIAGSVKSFKTATTMAVRVSQVAGGIGSSLFLVSQTLSYAAEYLDDESIHKSRLQLSSTVISAVSAAAGLVGNVSGMVSKTSFKATTKTVTSFRGEIKTSKIRSYTYNNTMKPREVVDAVGGILDTANTVVGTVGFATNNDKIKIASGMIGLGVSSMKFGANSIDFNSLDGQSKNIPAIFREYARASRVGSELEKLVNNHFTPFFNYDNL